MKVIHLSTYQERGGAATAASLFHSFCARRGIDSLLFVASALEKTLCRPNAIVLRSAFHQRIRLHSERIISRLLIGKYASMASLSLLPSRISSIIGKLSPDIVHIHWFHAGFLSVEDLCRLNCKLVLHCHDAWVLDGVFHVPMCLFEDFQDSVFSRLFRYLNLRRIDRLLARVSAIIVPSQHMADKLNSTHPLYSHKVIVIPNPVEDIFYSGYSIENHFPSPVQTNHITVCLSSASALADPVKNLQMLPNILDYVLASGYKVTVLSIGADIYRLYDHVPDGLSLDVYKFSSDKSRLREIILKADMFLSLSRFESFGLAVAEALVLGLPVCAFASDGVSELIAHDQNGYLAPPNSAVEFAKGIEYLYKKLTIGPGMNIDHPCFLSRDYAISKLVRLYSSIII